MSFHFESTEDFLESVKSIDTLIDFAKEQGEANKETNRILFLKLSIVSMVTKFQVYIEKVLEEFLFRLRQSKLKHLDLPICVRLNSLRLMAADYELNEKLRNIGQYNRAKLEEVRENILSMHNLCIDSMDIAPKFRLDCNFPLGKAGLTELTKLFKQIEGKDILESGGIDPDKLNSILNLRHNIVHQDANPQLTESMVAEYKEFINSIAKVVDKYLFSSVKF